LLRLLHLHELLLLLLLELLSIQANNMLLWLQD
jgi:hypothetical protein